MDVRRPHNSPLAALTEIVESRRCVAFVGAGLSQPDGYPGWPRLVKDICQACEVDEREPAAAQAARRGPLPLLRLASLAAKCNPDAYERTLRLAMSARPHTLDSYLWLARAPFQHYITTNYEDALLKAVQHLDCKPDCIQSFPRFRALASGSDPSRDVVFLHGRIVEKEPLQVVLNYDDYDAAYGITGSPQSMLPSFLEQTLPFHPICFIGCSLADELMRESVQRCHRWRSQFEHEHGTSAPPWYALCQAGSQSSDSFHACGTAVVEYAGESHEGLLSVLQQWAHYDEPRKRNIYSTDQEVPR